MKSKIHEFLMLRKTGMSKTKVLLAFVFCANTMLFGQRSGAIQGKITDKDSNDGISFAGVVLKKDGKVVASTVADVDGNYAFGRLTKGIYTVKARAVGYYGLTVLNLPVDTVAVRQNMGMEFDFVLSERPLVASATNPTGEEIVPTSEEMMVKEGFLPAPNKVKAVPAAPVSPAAIDRTSEEPVKFSIVVYPNPVHDRASIEISSDVDVTHGVLRIYDLAGAQVKMFNFSGKTAEFQREGLASGIYTYSITSAEQFLATGKLVIQ